MSRRKMLVGIGLLVVVLLGVSAGAYLLFVKKDTETTTITVEQERLLEGKCTEADVASIQSRVTTVDSSSPLAQQYSDIANCYQQIGDYATARDYMIKAADEYEKNGDTVRSSNLKSVASSLIPAIPEVKEADEQVYSN